MNARADFEDDFLTELHATESGSNVKAKKLNLKFETLLDEARHKFFNSCAASITALKSEDPKTDKYGNHIGPMFTSDAQGRYKITFKSGGKVVELVEGKQFFVVPSKDAAIEMFAKAALAAENKSLDRYLDAAASKTKQPPVGPTVIEQLRAQRAQKVPVKA